MAILFALCAALSNALGSIFQRLGIEEAGLVEGRGFLRGLLARPIWIGGLLTMAGGFVFQAIALHLGAVGVVQPLLLAELPFVILILVVWFSQAHARGDLVAVFGAAAGLAGLLGTLQPTDGTRVPPDGRWLVVIGGGLVVEVLCVLVALRGSPSWRALILGTGAAIGFSMVASLTKPVTQVLATSPGHIAGIWQTWALAAIGGGSFVVMQRAFESGPFSISQGGLILVNPVASIGIGALLFGCEVKTGVARVLLGLIEAAVLIGCLVVVLRSPLVAETHENSATHHLLGTGRIARYRAVRSRDRRSEGAS